MDFPDGVVVKNPPVNAGDMASISGLGSSPGEGSGNPLQYSCLGNPMDRRAWQAAVHGVTNRSDLVTKQQLRLWGYASHNRKRALGYVSKGSWVL